MLVTTHKILLCGLSMLHQKSDLQNIVMVDKTYMLKYYIHVSRKTSFIASLLLNIHINYIDNNIIRCIFNVATHQNSVLLKLCENPDHIIISLILLLLFNLLNINC